MKKIQQMHIAFYNNFIFEVPYLSSQRRRQACKSTTSNRFQLLSNGLFKSTSCQLAFMEQNNSLKHVYKLSCRTIITDNCLTKAKPTFSSCRDEKKMAPRTSASLEHRLY